MHLYHTVIITVFVLSSDESDSDSFNRNDFESPAGAFLQIICNICPRPVSLQAE